MASMGSAALCDTQSAGGCAGNSGGFAHITVLKYVRVTIRLDVITST